MTPIAMVVAASASPSIAVVIVGAIAAGCVAAIIGAGSWWASRIVRRLDRGSQVQTQYTEEHFRMIVKEAIEQLDTRGSRQIPLLVEQIQGLRAAIDALTARLMTLATQVHEHETSAYPHNNYHQ